MLSTGSDAMAREAGARSPVLVALCSFICDSIVVVAYGLCDMDWRGCAGVKIPYCLCFYGLDYLSIAITITTMLLFFLVTFMDEFSCF